MTFKAVIFDLDGTLIDSMGIWFEVDKEFLRKRNIAVPKNLFQEVEGGNSYTEIAQFFKDRFDLPESIEEIMEEWTNMVSSHYENDIRLKPGAAEFLDYLKSRSLKLGLGTSNCLSLTEAVLRNNSALNMFDSIKAGCTDIRGKPFPDIFLSVAEELGVEPEECLVIEDVLVGVQAARMAGMTVYAIEDEYVGEERNTVKQTADFYGKDFKELLQKIKSEVGFTI
jgi:HAD superfamily hydrolase (TIGR01509 family)